jgi:hypothetical protein
MTTNTTTTLSPAQKTPMLEDLTWVSDTHGWALFDGHDCAQSTCNDVLTTTDGGTTWTRIGVVPAPPDGCTNCDSPGVTQIRFANDLDGYAFDPDLYVTTDGGATWSNEPGPFVAALEPAGSNVMRIAFTQTGCPGPCDLTIQVATAGSASWRTLSVPFQGDAVRLVRQGPEDVYIASLENPAGGAGSAHAQLLISHDGGTTWVDRSDPCGVVGGDEYDTAELTAAAPFVVAALCQDRMEPQNTFVSLSTDGGAVFTPQPLIPGGADEIAAASATSVFAASSNPQGTGTTQYLLFSSLDGGWSWRQVASDLAENVGDPPPPQSPFLGFESASVGRWVVGNDVVWSSADGGASWVRQSLSP